MAVKLPIYRPGVSSHELATQTAESWDNYAGAAEAHFEQLKSVLDKEEPDYKD